MRLFLPNSTPRHMNPDAIFPAPDGRFCLEIRAVAMRMSHEVRCPCLRETASGQIIFHTGSLWDAEQVAWSADSQKLALSLRHYADGSASFDLQLDVPSRSARLILDGAYIIGGSFESVGGEMQRTEQLREIFY